MKRKPPKSGKKRNGVAKALRNPHYRQRKLPNKKKKNRRYTIKEILKGVTPEKCFDGSDAERAWKEFSK